MSDSETTQATKPADEGTAGGNVLPLPIGILIVVLWLGAVVPLAMLGWGSDDTSWRIAQTAHAIQESGRYATTEAPGYPLFELAAAVLLHLEQPPNVLGVAFGLLALWSLIGLARAGVFRHPRTTTIALAFAPVIVVSSASTTPHVPALACLLCSYRALLAGRATAAGAWLGAACGFSPCSAAFLLPAWILVRRHGRGAGAWWQFTSTAVFLAFLAYIGPLSQHSLSELWGPTSGVGQGYEVSWARLLSGLEVFGQPQGVVWLLILLWCALPKKQSQAAGPIGLALGISLLWLVLFVPLFGQPGVLLPALAFGVFVADQRLSARALAVVTALLLSFHAVNVDLATFQVRAGVTWQHVERSRELATWRDRATNLNVNQKTALVPTQPWVVLGHAAWTRDREMGVWRHSSGSLICIDSVRRKVLAPWRKRGFKLVRLADDEAWQQFLGANSTEGGP